MFDRFFGSQGKQRQSARSARRRKRYSASIEFLEKREVPATFTPGDLVVLQAGDGSNVYTSAAPLYLNEINPTSKAIVQQVLVPNSETVGGSGNQPVTLDIGTTAKSGKGTNGNGVGLLHTTFDSSGLTFTGNDANPNHGTFSTDNRVLASVGTDPVGLNAINTTTYGQFSGGDDTRGTVGDSPTGPFYEFGHTANGGLRYISGLTTGGSTVGTEVDTTTTKNNVREADHRLQRRGLLRQCQEPAPAGNLCRLQRRQHGPGLPAHQLRHRSPDRDGPWLNRQHQSQRALCRGHERQWRPGRRRSAVLC